ncbi:unnamed protein product [Blumeria hordei]|uniref:Uncharacterized protein n=2 Tax=Blumeria hordei TaxID=2867405 RepID=A0A383UWP4_BLUHO|nr:Bgh-specific hypothetical protein [Blumeria hordei DH14]SZF03780.1 unnamed protein product [Blumeria hordei]
MRPPSKHTSDSHPGRTNGYQLGLSPRELLRRETKDSNLGNQTSSAPTHRAIIWGIVCGILGASIIITLAVYLILRRRRSQHHDKEEEQETTKDSRSRQAIAKMTAKLSLPDAKPQPPAKKSISSISSPIPPRPRDSSSTLMGAKTKPNRPPTLCLDQRIRIITEAKAGNDYETPTGQDSSQNFRSDLYELPFISSTDNYLPIPAALLSPQTTRDNIIASFDKENFDIIYPPQKVAPTVPPKSRRPSLKSTLTANAQHALPSPGDWKNSGPPPTLTLQTNLVQPPMPSDEKDRESPVLGSMSTVIINKELPLPHENSINRSNSVSDKTGTSISSINFHMISDEDLDRLGVGLKF